MKKTNKDESNGVSKLLGLGAVVASLAGAYFLYGTKEGAKSKKKIKGWMLKAKGEALEKLENMKNVSEEGYNLVLEQVMKKYSSLKNVDKKELESLVSDLKKHWKNIKKNLK
jgi:hypothetical protein